MKNKILPPVVLALLLVGAGAFLASGRRAAVGRLPSAAESTLASGLPPVVPGFRLPSAAGPPAGQEPPRERFPRREVDEVFPGSVPPAGDWRHHHPATLQVAAYPGLPVTFRQVQVKEDGRHLTWIGRDPDLPGASFVGVATSEGYDAVMLVPGAAQYDFHVRAGQVLVEEVTATGSDCAVEPVMVAAARLPVPPGVHYADAAAESWSSPVAPAPGPRAAEAPVSVDVLFLYNTRALAVAAQRSNDPIGYMDGYSRAGLETCNQVLLNSRIDTFVWHYVGLEAVPEYPEKVTVPEDLDVIAPEGPLGTVVGSLRAQYGADQVLMWTGTGPRQGVAYAGDVRGDPVPAEYALAALRLTAGILILGHELSHNFGCQHDRGHAGSGDGSTSTPDGDGLWCYGLLWNDPVGGTTSGTVMSYADFLVPYFSNPDITLDVTSTLENRPGGFLNLGTRTIGFPETDPRAANNARILREHGAYMAALNEAVEAPPVILQQPADAVVAAGQVLSLNVSATGGGLAYQWRKDGTDIAGATLATYGKTFAAADAGGYSVRVSNGQGTVTSRVAAVSLAAAAPTPVPMTPSVPASASGGGGGGAPSVWFLFALLVAGTLRRGTKRIL